nr:hypothetical protein [Gulosibacter molinativorax]
MNLFKQIFIHQWLMPPGVFHSLVHHVAEVVAILQHAVHFVLGDRNGGPFGGRSGSESAICQFLDNVCQRVVVSGVQLERQPHEWCSLWVDLDRADLPAFGGVHHVQVAKLGPAQRATALGLLAHLVRDICARLTRLVFVKHRQHSLHELPDRGFVDRFSGRDERDATLLEVHTHKGFVVAVTRHARELVHDDVIDIAVSVDALQHLPKGHSLGHLGR